MPQESRDYAWDFMRRVAAPKTWWHRLAQIEAPVSASFIARSRLKSGENIDNSMKRDLTRQDPRL